MCYNRYEDINIDEFVVYVKDTCGYDFTSCSEGSYTISQEDLNQATAYVVNKLYTACSCTQDIRCAIAHKLYLENSLSINSDDYDIEYAMDKYLQAKYGYHF